MYIFVGGRSGALTYTIIFAAVDMRCLWMCDEFADSGRPQLLLLGEHNSCTRTGTSEKHFFSLPYQSACLLRSCALLFTCQPGSPASPALQPGVLAYQFFLPGLPAVSAALWFQSCPGLPPVLNCALCLLAGARHQNSCTFHKLLLCGVLSNSVVCVWHLDSLSRHP